MFYRQKGREYANAAVAGTIFVAGALLLVWGALSHLTEAFRSLPYGGSGDAVSMFLDARFIFGCPLCLIGARYGKQAGTNLSIIRQAEEGIKIDSLRGRSGSRNQTINAGDILNSHIHLQIEERSRELDQRSNSPLSGMTGMFAVSVAAIVAGALVTNLAGLTH